MNQITEIDLDTWPRRQHFEHFLTRAPCSYSVTTEIDVTDFVSTIRQTSRKSYITQIWAIAHAVNTFSEFKMTVTENGSPAIWDVIHPSFTVFHAHTETFSSLWVPFHPDLDVFSAEAEHTIAEHSATSALFPQGDQPPNTFDISSLPWEHFTGFHLNLDPKSPHLAPIFTLGQYRHSGSTILLPIAIQIHHAAADGFHTSRLIGTLRERFENTSWVQSLKAPTPHKF